MLEDYFDYEIRLKFDECIREDLDDYKADYSEFTIVDGEEGDYGTIKYYYGTELVAIKTVHGGDEEEIEYTRFGQRLFNAKLINALSKAIKLCEDA